ncbi:vWA domain-containing protein [Lignipirellula cremea]|uniref:VWFA domain-containing protein n=1 Tax=Lignipirellula cremea TaxID=2528010 RepID=A0A518E2A0_9BACT|nr:VWA domain-containing protein [Lignipirellula cremea]QDU98194.1 hypothetical protein Pla8534_60550 [Lignipirellula cremea]
MTSGLSSIDTPSAATPAGKTRPRWKFGAADDWSQWAFRPRQPELDRRRLELFLQQSRPVRCDPAEARIARQRIPAEDQRWRGFLEIGQICGVSTVLHLVLLLSLAACAVQQAVQNGLFLSITPAAAVRDEITAPIPLVVDQADQESERAAFLPAVLPRQALAVEPIEVAAWVEPGDLDPPRRLLADEVRGVLSGEGLGGDSGPGGTASAGADHGPSDAVGASFFGVRAAGSRFVFVVDCSLSMEGPKWNDARQELAAAIDRLGPERQFYVIFFDGETHRMFDDKEYAPALLSATPENLALLRSWLQTARLGYNTSPCQAVQFGVSLQPDALFLLSDGEFSDPTAPWLRKHNVVRQEDGVQAPGVAVHTIGFRSQQGQKVLSRIARENGGEYRYVP